MSPSHQTPRPLTTDEIKTYVQWFAEAADRAVNQAGFDGVELHFANGYLLDQFLQDVSNQRTDEYGGSAENRARFPLEVIEAVSKTIGEDRVGFRISPWNPWQGMRMEDPKTTFAYLVSQAKERFPDLAYLHAVEPRIAGDADHHPGEGDSNEFLRKIWGEKVYIAAGGFSPQMAAETVEAKGGLVAFGRHYIANVSSLSLGRLDRVLTFILFQPDLPLRLRQGAPLNKYQRSTFYTPGADGYTDYPAALLSQLSGEPTIVTPKVLDEVNSTTCTVPAA